MAREIIIKVHAEAQGTRFSDMSEGALDISPQFGEAQLGDVEGDGAGLGLGEVENVVDEGEEVVAGGVNGFGEFDLFGLQVALRVGGELLGQNEQTVQRR